MASSKMDEELRKAALRGDVDFLKYCVESNKPIEYYLTSFPMEEDQSGRCHYGNIFHMATMENKEEFIREAMGILPQEAKQQLLVQPGDEVYKYNPLHVAAFVGNVEIVKMFLDVYRCFPSHLLEHERPWLFKNNMGDNPCFVALIRYQEECAVEIYKMDTELISDMPSDRGSSLVYEAVHTKMSKLALVILRSPHPISCGGGNDGYTPFHSIHFIEGSENFIAQLMDRHPELIKGVDKEGSTIVHSWIKSDKEWLFKFILESKWKDQFVKLINVKDYNYQNNPFHVAATTTHEATNQIVPLLVEAYKKHNLIWRVYAIYQLPWFEMNKDYEGPLHLALRNKREDLGLYILSLLLDDQIMDELLDNYKPEHAMLFLAIQNNCSEVAKDILGNLDKRSRTKYLKDSSTGCILLQG